MFLTSHYCILHATRAVSESTRDCPFDAQATRERVQYVTESKLYPSDFPVAWIGCPGATCGRCTCWAAMMVARELAVKNVGICRVWLAVRVEREQGYVVQHGLG